jgi:2-phosphosulfolactate phosphatase
VVPFLEINDALAAALRVGRQTVVLGGERKGLKIDGFDLGNSPAEYTPESIQGRPVFITTTNGTRALRLARLAKSVVAAAFLNLSAVVVSLKDEPQIDILCAGTDGSKTSEDILLAGAIVHALMRDGSRSWDVNESAASARREWNNLIQAAEKSGEPLHNLLTDSLNASLGGRNCIEVGNAADIPYCAQIDLLDVVPRLNLHDWKITAS